MLSSLIASFVRKDRLEGDNQYECPTCDKKADARLGTRIKAISRVLVLSLGYTGCGFIPPPSCTHSFDALVPPLCVEQEVCL